MRCTTAVILSALAIGEAAAGSIRHAGFHARRAAEEKRQYGNVNWNQAVKDVNWSTVNFGGNKPAATPAPAQNNQPSQPEVVAQAKPTAAAAPSAAAPKPSAPSSNGDNQAKTESTSDISSVAENIANDVSALLSGAGISTKDDPLQNGQCFKGDSTPYKATFTNKKKEDALVVCWNKMGTAVDGKQGPFAGMTLNIHKPAISVKIPQGKTQTISFKKAFSGACAPIYKGIGTGKFGGVENTWFEVTWPNPDETDPYKPKKGGFNVSRNVKMQGDSISAKGSKCTSDMETCVFKCKNGMQSCTEGKDYDLYNKGPGCSGGFDVAMQGTGGSCEIPDQGDNIQITLG